MFSKFIMSLMICIVLVPPALAATWSGQLVRQTAATTLPTRYCLNVDGKRYELDDHGNVLANQIVKVSINKKEIMVAVDGTLHGNAITVKQMIEVLDTPRKTFGK